MIFCEHKFLYRRIKAEVPDGRDADVARIGEARVMRAGRRPHADRLRRDDLELSLSAAEELAARDVEAEVIDLRTLVPYDERDGARLGAARPAGR